jgi:hypothetical protein
MMTASKQGQDGTAETLVTVYQSKRLHIQEDWNIHHEHCDSLAGWNSVEFHPDPAWKLSSNLQEIYQCRMYSRKLLTMGKGNARNM